MIFRNYLGLDITPGELRAVTLRRKGRAASMTGARLLSLPPGRLAPSPRESNVVDIKRLAENIREVLDPLAGREDRVALSLPDAAGRILLTEVEMPFKSRAEGMEILKWQLKSSLPLAAQETRLDYQLLEKNENGRYRVVVALTAEKVLRQYEEILAAAGYNAALIDFHSLNLYNYYRPRLDLGEDFILLGVEGGTISLQYFQGRSLTYHRSRETEPQASGIFQELNRTLVSCQKNFPAFGRATVYLHSNWDERAELLEALRSSFERDLLPLQPHLEKLLGSSTGLSSGGVQGLVAAVGAAERMM